MPRVASNPFCVWADCKMRTYKTLRAAESAAARNRGRVGEWSDDAGWWVERSAFVLPADLAPGDRVAVSFGVVTVRNVSLDGDRVTMHWEEPQPAVTQSRYNTVHRLAADPPGRADE